MRVRISPRSDAAEAFEVQAGTYAECLAMALDLLGHTPQQVSQADGLHASQPHKDARRFTAQVYTIGADHGRTCLGELEGFAINFDDIKKQARECFLNSCSGPTDSLLDVRVDWHDQK